MTKYLDQNSLSYFWTKIKAYFAKKTEVLHLTGGTLTGPVSGTDLTLSNNLNVDKNVTVGGKITVSDGEYYSMDILGDEYLYQLSADTVADASKSYYVLDDGSYEPVDLSGYDNLAWTRDQYEYPTEFWALTFEFFDWLEAGQEYTLQLWDVDVSHSGKTEANLGIGVYYCEDCVLGTPIGPNYFTNGHADHITIHFTPYDDYVESQIEGDPAPTVFNKGLSTIEEPDFTGPQISIVNSPDWANGTMNLTVGAWKLEKGSVATEWTQHVSDVDPTEEGWFEKNGPRPGHGVAFGMPCSDEGFHIGIPVTIYSNSGPGVPALLIEDRMDCVSKIVEDATIPTSDLSRLTGQYDWDGEWRRVGYSEINRNNATVYRSFAVTNPKSGSGGTAALYLDSRDSGDKLFDTNCRAEFNGTVKANNSFILCETGVTRNTNPSTSQWPNALEICDSKGTVIGYVRGQFINDNYEGVQLETLRTINGSNYYHGVRFEISNTGAYRTSFNQPASVRTGLGLGSLATKNNVSNGLQCVDVSVKYANAVSAGGTATVNLSHAAIAGKMVFGVGAIVYNGWAWNLVSYDIDGFGVNTAVTIKTYWRATSATAANSITVTVQLLYINANPS